MVGMMDRISRYVVRLDSYFSKDNVLMEKNKFIVLLNWIWNYFNYKQSLRLVLRPKQRPLEA